MSPGCLFPILRRPDSSEAFSDLFSLPEFPLAALAVTVVSPGAPVLDLVAVAGVALAQASVVEVR